MDRSITYFVLAFNLAAAIVFFVKRKAEVPLFLALFNIFVEYRLISLKAGYSDWVDFEYVIPFKWNFDIAYKVSDLILMGSSVMMYAFMLFYKPAVKKAGDNNELLFAFVRSRKKVIVYGLAVFGILSFLLSGSGTGYATLIRLGNTSFIIFFFLLTLAQPSRKPETRLLYSGLFLALAYITYDTALRFQFLGWMIPVGYYLTRNIPPVRKVILSITGICVIMVVFSAAGVLRYKKLSDLSLTGLVSESVDRLKIADDVNFIDGFMMMYQVFPNELPYGYGQEHLNILLRPIPRSLWPEKPLASWVRNVEARHGWYNEDSAGFSPTIWGVFYSEGGPWAVALLSIVWAFFIAKLYRALSYFNSDLSAFLVPAMLTSMIPVFRSGDLAGDFAIVLMSFWPLIVFTYLYKKFLKQQAAYALV